MKKNYFFKPLLFLIPITAFALMSLSGGRDGAFSGSPGDSNATCSSCHSGGSFGASVGITTDIPITGYAFNTPYNITVTTSSSASRHGFQLTAERDSDNSKVGSFTAGTGNQVVNGGTHMTHTNPNQNSWSFTWTSPSSDIGPVTLYASSIAANANGGTSGDQVVTTNTGSVSSLGISQSKLLRFDMYPNPSSDIVNIQLPDGTTKASVGLFDYTGRLIRTKEITPSDAQINVSNLSQGMYLIRVTSDRKVGAKQFIKR